MKLTLLAYPESIGVETDAGFSVHQHLLFILDNSGEAISLTLSEDVLDVTEVKLWFMVDDTPVASYLPQNVEKAVIHFLTNHHVTYTDWFDCYEFANLIHKIPRHREELASEHWRFEERSPETGDIVFLMNNGNRFRHVAVNVGNNFYLSVLGAGGYLMFASLEQMQDAWEPDITLVATPVSAVKDGSDLLIIGRPITNDKNPYEAVKKTAGEIIDIHV